METKELDPCFFEWAMPALRSRSPDARAQAIAQLFHSFMQWDLFTILRCDHLKAQTERIYSSDRVQHPTGGRKPFNPIVLKREFIQGNEIHWCKSAAEIAYSYSNDPKALQYAGAMNIPVVWDGNLLGMLNLLKRSKPFEHSDDNLMIAMAAFSIPLFLRKASDLTSSSNPTET